MRGTFRNLLSLLLGLILLTGRSHAQRVRKTTAEEALEEDGPKGTTFNGQEVPPIMTLEGPTWKDTVEVGYWLVEAYSPYCHHCQSLAPKWQTLYEYYYTSDPVPASSEPIDSAASLNSFSRYYNMKFAKLDCVAFGTACVEIGSQSFPTILLLKNGEEIKRSEGDKDIQSLSRFVEDCLEMIRPGSRPVEGIELPPVGATKFYPKGTAPISPPSHPEDRQATSILVNQAIKSPEKSRMPNPSGTSVPFTAETFQRQVTKSLVPWFVKFYAPWCSHCQRMQASWSTMAREMQGQLDVGEVNCDVEKRLCKEMNVKSFPTIVYFRGPEHLEYEGMRGLGDLIEYGNQAVESQRGVERVNATEFATLEETEEVIFVYFYDHATTSEDLMALERLPMTLLGRARIVKTDDRELGKRFDILTYPRLLVSRAGKAVVFPFLMPQEMRNVDKVREWMQTVWHPLVPELTAANAQEIMDRKFVVLGILNRDRPEDFTIAKREIKNAALEWMDRQGQQYLIERQELRDAKQLRIEEAEDRNDQRALGNAKRIRINMNDIERKNVAFAWVDGVFWERWTRTTFGITSKDDGDKVIINDWDNRRYWDQTSTGNPIVPSRTSILETLTQIYANPPKLASKATGSSMSRFYFKTRNLLFAHPWLFAEAGILSLFVALLMVARGRGRRRRGSFGTGGFLRLESEKEKGVFGAGANGKAD